MITRTHILRTAASLAAVLLLSPALLPVRAASDPTVSRREADYTGKGSRIAVIGAGFDVTHPVFAEAPPSPALTREDTEAVLPGAYRSEKLPAVWDFTDSDSDVASTALSATAAASLCAGRYTGLGDQLQEDGTVLHDSSFTGAAPDAQLLLFKAAQDRSTRIESDAAARAVRAALQLKADSVWLDTSSLTVTAPLKRALEEAEEAGVPIFVGAGDLESPLPEIPATYTDHGTLTAAASLPGVYAVGAAGDPYADVIAFTLTLPDSSEQRISYVDSCPDYFESTFASMMAGSLLPIVAVPGIGSPADYEGLDVTGAVAVVLRGEIPFTEKVEAAADAGAAAVIVADNGGGVSRMALEGAPIPAVMVDSEAGSLLLGTEGAFFSVKQLSPSLADFSASGIAEDLLAAPVFLCEAQGVKAAIPPTTSSLNETVLYAAVSGTKYAASLAAGYTARAAEYARTAKLDSVPLLSLTASAALAMTDADGDPLSPRQAGAGLLTGSGSYAALLSEGEAGGSVSLPGRLLHNSASFTVQLRNLSEQRKQYTVRISVYGDSVRTDSDGTALLTGESELLSGIRAYLGDSYVNISASDGNENAAVITLDPGETAELPVRISPNEAARRERSSVFWNGWFADGVITFTDEAGTSTVHPFSAFFGNWEAAPLADASIYSGDSPVFGACRLAVRRFDDSASSSLYLGAENPWTSFTTYSESYNLVNPALLRYGWAELELYALRSIDRIEIEFYDSERRLVFSRTHTPHISKASLGGSVQIPLWDFIAEDNEFYLFPAGEYTTELRLSSSFGDAGDAVQYLGFTFTVDDTDPTIRSLAVYREEDRTYLSLSVFDDHSLLDVAVYDTVFTYGQSGEALLAGKTEAELIFDITQYDAIDPLYVELTDRTGNFVTVRLSAERFAALLEAEDSGEAAP